MIGEYGRYRPLAELATGARAVFRSVHAGHVLSRRLAAMGLVDGAQIEVLQNPGHGPVLVRVKNARVALGHNEAMRVLVEEIEP